MTARPQTFTQAQQGANEDQIADEIGRAVDNPRSSRAQRQPRKRQHDAKPVEVTSPEMWYAENICHQVIATDGPCRFGSRDGMLFEWVNTHWAVVQDKDGERRAWQWLSVNCAQKATPRVARSCHEAAVLHAPPLPDAQEPGIVPVPVKNGCLRVDEREACYSIADHDPAAGLTYCLACEYSEGAEAPTFGRFLQQVLPDRELRDLVQEYVGYSLMRDCRHQIAMLMVGTGRNGKGTLAQIVTALHERPIALDLANLDGFALAGLIGASLVYVDETPPRIDEQRFKTLVSGDLIQIDRKYREPVSLRPTAKWLLAANQLPRFSDHSVGQWRRLVVVPFNRYFGDNEVDPMLAQRVIKGELSGVLNWALEGLVRLLARGRFAPLPEAVRAAAAAGRKETDSIVAWADEAEPQRTDDPRVAPKDAVYRHYTEWCRANTMQPVASPRFWQRLAQLPTIGRLRFAQPTVGGKRQRTCNIAMPAS